LNFKLSILIICLYACTCNLFASIKDPEGDPSSKRDTLSAVVSYGDSWLTRQAFDMDKQNLSLLLDSLYSLEVIPFETIDYLYFASKLQKRNKWEIENALDSLFALDTIPYALINEINFYLNNQEEEKLPIHFASLPQDDSPYPANAFYNS